MGAEQSKKMGRDMGTAMGTAKRSRGGTVWYKKWGKNAKEATETLNIWPHGEMGYTILAYHRDMSLSEYLLTEIVPNLKLELSDNGDTVKMCIGLMKSADDIVLFDFETRQKKMGDLIEPGSNLFCKPMEECDLPHFRYNATS